jgi:hypothetical protein
MKVKKLCIENHERVNSTCPKSLFCLTMWMCTTKHRIRVWQWRLMFLCWVVYNNAVSGEVFKARGVKSVHAWEFGWRNTCDCVVPARWHHITYCMNEYGEVAQNVSTSSNLAVSWFKLAVKIFWFLSPWLFFVGLSEKSHTWDGPPLWMNSRPVSQKQFMMCYNTWWMISLSSSNNVSLWKGCIYCILFPKSEQYMYQT